MAKVRGQNHHRITEVHLTPYAIGQLSFLKNLKQHVHHIGMRLFDLIEKHDGVRAATHTLRQLPPFIMTNISWRRAHQTGDIKLLHIFGHVDLNQGRRITKDEFGKHLCQQRLANPRWPQENE